MVHCAKVGPHGGKIFAQLGLELLGGGCWQNHPRPVLWAGQLTVVGRWTADLAFSYTIHQVHDNGRCNLVLTWSPLNQCFYYNYPQTLHCAMRSTAFRLFRTAGQVHHENPLVSNSLLYLPKLTSQGLPRSGTPPSWPRKLQRRKITGVEKVIAVSSAKGGVGKSTVAGMSLPARTS